MNVPPQQLPMGMKLSLLWLFAILNMLFRDIHELTTASAVNEIIAGTLNGVPVTETLLVIGAIIVELLLIAMMASWMLPAKQARLINLILAPIAIIGTIAA